MVAKKDVLATSQTEKNICFYIFRLRVAEPLVAVGYDALVFTTHCYISYKAITICFPIRSCYDWIKIKLAEICFKKIDGAKFQTIVIQKAFKTINIVM